MGNDKRTIGERIDDLLKQNNMTNKELSDKVTAAGINLSPATLSDIISDKDKGYSYKIFVEIAKQLNVSTDYLFGLSEVATPNTDVKTICEYTGLSELSVNSLNWYSLQSKTINNFYDSDDTSRKYNCYPIAMLNFINKYINKFFNPYDLDISPSLNIFHYLKLCSGYENLLTEKIEIAKEFLNTSNNNIDFDYHKKFELLERIHIEDKSNEKNGLLFSFSQDYISFIKSFDIFNNNAKELQNTLYDLENKILDLH